MKYTAYLMAAVIILVVVIPYGILSIFSSPETEQNQDDSERKYISSTRISVFLEEEQQTVDLPLEEYVSCVVASEMPASFALEALKAQAVAARTYGLARQGSLCDTVHCQVYRSKEEIRALKGQEWMETYWEKIQDAAYETAGQVMYYNGALAGQVLFHSSTGGRTENSEEVFVSAVPYLRSVDSPYEEEATHRKDEVSVPIGDFVNLINGQYGVTPVTAEDVKGMAILSRNEGQTVAELKVGENRFTGKQIRSMLNLSSANFTFAVTEDTVVITSVGYGHGVGMSQYGANGMAKKGYSYDKILAHYYTGITIEQYSPQ